MSTSNRSGIQRVSAAHPCPICGRPKDCFTSSKGKFYICFNEAAGSLATRTTSSGRTFYRHRGPEYQEQGERRRGKGKRTKQPATAAAQPAAQAAPQQPQAATAEVVQYVDPALSHAAFSAVLPAPILALSDAHRTSLRNRGLTDAQIERNQYRSVVYSIATKRRIISVPNVPPGPWDRVQEVPGFHAFLEPSHALQFKIPAFGYLIPVRDREGRIVKMMLRKDHDSDGTGKYTCLTSRSKKFPDRPSPGNPLHHPLGTPQQAGACLIVEGILKADVTAALSGWTCIGVNGVDDFLKATPVLKAMRANTVILAFDADCRVKQTVASGLRNAVVKLRADGFIVHVAHWPAACGKGIDDVLSTGHQNKIQRAKSIEEVDKLVAEICESAGVTPEQQAALAPPAVPLGEAPDDPHALATSFIRKRYCHPGSKSSRLRFWKGAFYVWSAARGCDKTISETEIVANLTTHIKVELDRDYEKNAPEDSYVRKVTRSLVSDTLNVVRSLSIISGDLQPPCWLITPEQFTHPPQQLLVTPTALLHVPSIESGSQYEHPATPDFFALAATSWSYDPAAPEPAEWLKFLADVWGDDHGSIGLVQEWCGLNLVPDTSFQKLLLLCGPRRSGKGVLCRTLTALVGEGNVAAPSLSSLAERFGLAPLVGKLSAIIADARLSGKADQTEILEKMLKIVGEDSLQIDRKYLESLIAQLTVRFTIACNEIPKLQDQANALSGRTLLLPMTRSFFGQEDSGLSDRLRQELPSIARWAISGLQRLYRCGRFEQPESGKHILQEMADLQSPITSFLRNRCYVDLQDERLRADKQDLYECYRSHCEAEGLPPRSMPVFCRDLRTALPGLRDIQTNALGIRVRKFVGIRIGVDDQPQDF